MNTIEVLTKQLAGLLKCEILPRGSYLAGGTAVYLYLKHRLSVDIDFFSPGDFTPGEDYEYQLKTSFLYFDDAEKEVGNIMMLKQDGAVERIKEKEWNDIKNFFKEFLK